MSDTRPPRSRICPSCGATGIPLVYGMPPYFPLGMAAELGLVSLAGCSVGESDPTWTCPHCETTWHAPGSSRAIREAERQVEQVYGNPLIGP